MTNLGVPDSELLIQLEQYCVLRKREALKRGVRGLLGEFPDSLPVRLRALDWFWRSGLQREGLKLAIPEGKLLLTDVTPEKLGNERTLWLMIFVIGQSGWPYAWRWLGLVGANSPKERGLLSQVLMDLGEYRRAWELVQDFSVDATLHVGITRLMIAWRGGYHQDGLRSAEHLLRQLPETDWITRWWTGCLLEYFKGRLREPAAALNRFLAIDSGSPDAPLKAPRLYALTRIWLGLLRAESGDRNGALLDFETAEIWFKSHVADYVPLRLLDLYFWKEQAGLLSESERLVILEYPGPPPAVRRCRARLRQEEKNRVRVRAEGDRIRWQNSPKADEYSCDGSVRLGIPLELRLLALLSRAGRLGLHRNLAKALLWPEEVRNFFQLDGRLAKLVERLREVYELNVAFEKECFFLSEADLGRVVVNHDLRRPEFFQTQGDREFLWEDVARHYRLGATQARGALRKWLEGGWIFKVGSGRLTRYRVSG
jgi:hypothetical protein